MWAVENRVRYHYRSKVCYPNDLTHEERFLAKAKKLRAKRSGNKWPGDVRLHGQSSRARSGRRLLVC